MPVVSGLVVRCTTAIKRVIRRRGTARFLRNGAYGRRVADGGWERRELRGRERGGGFSEKA